MRRRNSGKKSTISRARHISNSSGALFARRGQSTQQQAFSRRVTGGRRPRRRESVCCAKRNSSSTFSKFIASAASPSTMAAASWRGGAVAAALLSLLLTVSLGCMRSFAFEASIDLGPSQRRCIGEQLSKHVLVIGEFKVTHPAPGAPSGAAAGPLLMHVQATDPVSKTPVFQQSSRDRVKTGFTSTKPGVHMFCVRNIAKHQITVDVQLLWGPAARDYSQLAKAEHLDEVMVQLLQLQDKLKLYHNNILFMREPSAAAAAADLHAQQQQQQQQQQTTSSSGADCCCDFTPDAEPNKTSISLEDAERKADNKMHVYESACS
ncbi:hypothetical protein Efla_007444 [Eimeria flavescens]